MENTINTKPSDDIDPKQLAQAGAAVADLAHLAKNILQVLSGCAEIIDLALDTNQLDRVRQAWKLHQPGFWRLKKLQLDLIKFAKAYPLNTQPCDMNAVINAAVKQLEPFFTKRSIHLALTLTDDLPAIIADSEKLRDTVLNLLVTAADNLQDQPGQITLQTSLNDTKKTLQITVSDSGPRLEADICKAMKSPLERSRNMLGTGLEMPLAYQTTQAHRGRLLINPDPTAPNTLTLTLPLNIEYPT